MKGKKLMTITILALVGAVVAARAEEKDPEAASGAASAAAQGAALGVEGPFEVKGSFDLGFRSVDVSGNENKFFEDLNLKTGPRLFNLDLDVTPVGSAFFDVLNIRAANLGGDPFESLGVSIKKYGKFNFSYRRNKSTYFYNDTLLPHELESITAANGGDFTTFNFDRTNDSFGMDVNVTQQAKVFANFNRQSRIGTSTYTLDISRDEFEFEKPLEEIKNDYTVGFQVALDKASIYFDETYRDYENDWHLFLSGASLGGDPEDATELFFFEQLMPYDYKMPQSTFKLNLRPDPRFTVNVGFIYSTLDAQIDYEETTRGISYRGSPIDTVVEGGGTFDRTMKLADIDFIFSATDKVSFIGGARFHRFDQEGQFSIEGDVEDTGTEIATDIFEAGVQVYPSSVFTLTGGVRFEKRDTIFLSEGERHQEPATERTTFFVTGIAAPSTKANILVEYERGDYDNPFTDVSPTSQDRFKGRVRLKPVEGLSIVGNFYYRKIDNSLSGGTFDTTDFNAFVGYDVADVSLYGSYSRRNIDNEIDTPKNPSFAFPVLYESSVNMGRGGFRYAFTEQAKAGAEVMSYTNAGTFPLDWRVYEVFAEFTSPGGYLFRLSFQRNDYGEDLFDFDDYKSNIFQVSIGYKF